MSVHILGSHVMVRWILVVMRSALVSFVRGGVVAFVASVVKNTIGVGRSDGVRLTFGRDGMRSLLVNWGGSVGCLSVHLGGGVRSFSMLRSSVRSLVARSFMVNGSGMRSLNVVGSLMVDGGSNMRCLVMNGSGLVVNGGTLMSSHVVGLVLMNGSGVGSLVRNLFARVLHMGDGGVELGLAVSHMGVLGVTRLGCHLVGLLVVSLNRHVLHDGD